MLILAIFPPIATGNRSISGSIVGRHHWAVSAFRLALIVCVSRVIRDGFVLIFGLPEGGGAPGSLAEPWAVSLRSLGRPRPGGGTRQVRLLL